MTGHFIQADTIVPEAGSSKAYDRYGYAYYNPITNNDPTGHWPEWFDQIGQFFTGFGYEFVRTSNWMGAITSPRAAESLAPSTSETNVMLAGRIAGDIAAIALGVTEIVGGGTIAGGGAVVGCGTTLCLASAPAIAAGAAVVAGGVVTTTSGSLALGGNLGIAFSRRHQNDLRPDPKAIGPHSTFKRDPATGRITNYETYRPQTNPNNLNPWERILRYDGIGKPHPDTATKQYILPHIHDYINKIVRAAFGIEIPK